MPGRTLTREKGGVGVAEVGRPKATWGGPRAEHTERETWYSGEVVSPNGDERGCSAPTSQPRKKGTSRRRAMTRGTKRRKKNPGPEILRA